MGRGITGSVAPRARKKMAAVHFFFFTIFCQKCWALEKLRSKKWQFYRPSPYTHSHILTLFPSFLQIIGAAKGAPVAPLPMPIGKIFLAGHLMNSPFTFPSMSKIIHPSIYHSSSQTATVQISWKKIHTMSSHSVRMFIYPIHPQFTSGYVLWDNYWWWMQIALQIHDFWHRYM